MWFFGKKKKAQKEAKEKELAKKAEEEKLAKEKAAKEKAAKEQAEKEQSAKEPVKKQPVAKEQAKEPAKEQAKETAKEEETKEVDVVVEEGQNKTRKAIYRVLFDKEDDLWKIKKDGAKRVIGSFKTKDEALARVQELSKSQDSKFVVYKKDGKFQKKANLNLKNTDKNNND